MHDLFERPVARQYLQRMAADDQPSCLTIDIGLYCLRGDDIFQTAVHQSNSLDVTQRKWSCRDRQSILIK